jgi:uncharacterized phiE125 gp8 family phage protein
MALKLYTAPAAEPVTLTEAKAHLRVEHTSDDTLITALIVAARTHAEAFTRRAFVTQTWDYFADAFPEDDGAILLPLPKVQSVSSISYVDDNGTTQVWSSSNYLVDVESEPARVTPAYDVSWPTTREQINAVTIRFIAGYGNAAAVPQAIKQAMLLIIGHLYEHREAVSDFEVFAVPQAAEYLLWPHRALGL